MKARLKRRLLIGGALVMGIPAVLCIIFVGLNYWGLCFGVDPMEAGVEKDGVSATLAGQRMGDQRTYIFVENKNDREVGVDLVVSIRDAQTKKPGNTQVRAMLGPHSAKRIYPGAEVLSLSVTKH